MIKRAALDESGPGIGSEDLRIVRSQGLKINKRLRARGGCLGTCWRRKTVKATKESGELPIER